MSYGFDNNPVATVKLPTQPRDIPVNKPAIESVLQAGAELGFVSREPTARRKPGPRRVEAQDKITVTGPKRIIDRLKAYCDANGGMSYCDAIADLLDTAK